MTVLLEPTIRQHLKNRVTARDVVPELDGRRVSLFGWVHEIRDLGKLVFVVLRDVSGICQIVFRMDELAETVKSAVHELTNESVICVCGVVVKQPKSRLGVEVVADEIEVLSKAVPKLEFDPTGKVQAGMDVRLRYRILDLRKPEVKNIFIVGSEVLKALRDFFYEKGFIEVRTPKIIGTATEGGADLFEVKYFDRSAYLAQSPQLYKEQLTTVFEKVFEIGPYFRAEESHTRRHISEFTSVDIEQAFADMEDVMQVLEEAVVYVHNRLREKCEQHLKQLGVTLKTPKPPFPRITYDEALEFLRKEGEPINWGEDFGTPHLRKLGKKFTSYYWITHFPSAIKPFYIEGSHDNPAVSESFDFMFQWLELASGGTRVSDYDVLMKKLVEKGLNPAMFEDHLKVFRYGMPVHAGWGLGFERFLMVLTRRTNIRETVLFPRDRFRLSP